MLTDLRLCHLHKHQHVATVQKMYIYSINVISPAYKYFYVLLLYLVFPGITLINVR